MARTDGTGTVRGLRELGDFTILEEIGRGGMGVVYRARQRSMGGRTVALKVLPSFVGMDHDAVARFRREAEAAGRLSHPGIVPIYAVGEDDGVHYYAMELVEGPSLWSLLQSLRHRSPERLLGTLAEESALDEVYPGLRDPAAGATVMPGARYARSCAKVVADVAAALAVAHAGRVIHRDLKPSNILIHRSGRPVLVDFGLARDEMRLGLTRSGDALGTPSYMAPEQARGESDVDGRADVYGLGATLYEMLTLRPPFDGAHAGEIMRKIMEDDPVPVRQLNPRVPVDLHTIVTNCLAKEPDERYPAIEAMEMDLRAFLAGRPVTARRPSLRNRLSRFVGRHHRAATVGVVVLALCALAFSLMGLVAARRAASTGRAALAGAREHLVLQHLDSAMTQYGRAEAFLGAAPVRAARLQHLCEVFDPLYAQGQLEYLTSCLESFAEHERGLEWQRLAARLEGRGTVRVDLTGGAGVGAGEGAAGGSLEALIRIRRLDPVAGLGPWRPFEPDESLPVGEYLVEVERPGLARVVHRVPVARDADAVVVPLACLLGDLPPGMVLAVPERHDRAVSVGVTEVDCTSWAHMLRSVEDEGLRRELLPPRWDEEGPPGDGGLPVAGLSFRQARAAAALLGGHLLTEEEFLLAGTGGLRGLRYPWGDRFDWSRVAATVDGLSRPMSVESLPEGASPLGVHHLSGNVAELLSPGGAGPPRLAGGHYQSTLEELSLEGAHRPITDFGAAQNLAGLRIARFVAPPTDPAQVAAAERAVAAAVATGGAGLLADWLVHADGRVSLAIEMSGLHPQDRRTAAFPMVTEGFLQVEPYEVYDGVGATLPFERQAGSYDDASRFVVRFDPPAVRGRNFRLRLGCGLLPLAGLYAHADSYIMRVPIKATGAQPCVHRVRLPAGCRVEEVEPLPTFSFHEDGAPVLIWSFPADRSGRRSLIAGIRFRKDGPLTSELPVFEQARGFAGRFLDALEDRGRGADGRIQALLSPSFLQVPHDERKPRPGLEAFLDRRVVDVTAVGPIVTVWATVDWVVDDGRVSVNDWPLRLQIDRRGGRLRMLSMAPAGTVDRGRLCGGVYRHEDLDVELSVPPGVFVHRDQGQLTEMQIVCTRDDLEDVAFSVVGFRAEGGADEDHVLHTLTMGAISARPGRRMPGERIDTFGPEDRPLRARVWDWKLAKPGGEVVDRERWWLLLGKGKRKFLVRESAQGSSAEEAERKFRAARGFFDDMARALVIR